MADLIELSIVRGLLAAPSDNLSAETPVFEVSLISPTGIALLTEGWDVNFPTTKSVFAESSISPGRLPLSEDFTNVSEVLRLTITNVDLSQRYAAFSALNRMRADLMEFWSGGGARVDPVYLKVWFAGAFGPQYALLYVLDVDAVTDLFDLTQPFDVNISLEREALWRSIPPGANSLEVHFQSQGKVRGSAAVNGYDVNDLSLVAGTDHFIYQADLPNRHEWQPDALGDQHLAIATNYVEIDGSRIPGDAPALLFLSITDTTTVAGGPLDPIYVGLSSKETSKISHNGETKANSYILAAGDADVTAGGVKTVATADTGVISNNSASVKYYVQMAAPGSPVEIRWGSFGATILNLDRELLRGTFLVFVRGNQTTAGTVGDVTAQLTVSEKEQAVNSADASIAFPAVNLPIDASFPHLTYIGRLQIPFSGRSTVSLSGYGRQIRESLSNIEFVLTLTHVTASKTSRIVDLILLPIDEWLVKVTSHAEQSNDTVIVLDGTGYLTRGVPEAMARTYLTNAISGGSAVELTGDGLWLWPGKTQRLYFLYEFSGTALPSCSATIRGSIVPRWIGPRTS